MTPSPIEAFDFASAVNPRNIGTLNILHIFSISSIQLAKNWFVSSSNLPIFQNHFPYDHHILC